jgi:hypothetical protein
MANLDTKIKLYLEANSKVYKNELNNFELQDNSDGNGAFISSWNVSGLAKPTAEQIASYETAGNAAEANNVIDATRRTEYLSWDKQMEMIYKDQKNGTTTFKDHCDKVRSDNPKG